MESISSEKSTKNRCVGVTVNGRFDPNGENWWWFSEIRWAHDLWFSHENLPERSRNHAGRPFVYRHRDITNSSSPYADRKDQLAVESTVKSWHVSSKSRSFSSDSKLQSETRDLSQCRYDFFNIRPFQSRSSQAEWGTFSIWIIVPMFHLANPFPFNLPFTSLDALENNRMGKHLHPCSRILVSVVKQYSTRISNLSARGIDG
jgi:hypothetical protein